jgi:hypothetical protein
VAILSRCRIVAPIRGQKADRSAGVALRSGTDPKDKACAARCSPLFC